MSEGDVLISKYYFDSLNLFSIFFFWSVLLDFYQFY